MVSLKLAALSAAVAALAGATATIGQDRSQSCHWKADQFKDFIVFGDSYSDETRAAYLILHGGDPPPPGTMLPPGYANTTAVGGRMWDRYVVQYTHENLTLYNYAVSGAVCSNNITSREFTLLHKNFPDIDGYEIPAFLADKTYGKNVATGAPFFNPPITESNTVYAIFIGGNDLGVFFSDAQANGTTLVDYTDCVWTQFDRLYAAGGRYFVAFNVPPLDLTPLYANASEGGLLANQYDASRNASYNRTAGAIHMKEFTDTTNAVYRYKTPYEAVLADRYPGAHFALYDVHKLFTDIHARPHDFLNGTAPLNVTGFVKHCDTSGASCTYRDSPDSYLWYDPLHPTEQVERLIARNFVDLLAGRGEYVTYFDAPG